MKFWKQAALLLMSVFVIGNMTACSGNTHVNDATKGSDTGETLDEDIEKGVDKLEDGAEDLEENVEDGVKDLGDDMENALDGDGRTESDR